MSKKDDVIEKKYLRKIQKKLKSKYSKPARSLSINLNKKPKSLIQKIFSAIGTVTLGCLSVVCIMIVISNIFCITSNCCPTIFGYSDMKIATDSMTAETITINEKIYDSGFKVGDTIIVRTVDASTLKVGDKIAFYTYSDDYARFYSKNRQRIDVPETTKTRYKTSFLQFLGIQSKEIRTASSNNAVMVFHHIVDIYQSEDGELWFQTQGSSNALRDSWIISEKLIVGIYDNSNSASMISNFSAFVNSNFGFLIAVLLPFLSVMLWITISFINSLHSSFLILDVIEEKAKLTDPVCIKNKIGYKMDTKEKLKVLAQADDDMMITYVPLLWKHEETPINIKKYALKKKIMFKPIKMKLNLNRECEKMLKDGCTYEEIAKYYTKQRKIIDNEELRMKKRMTTVKNIFRKVKRKNNIKEIN